MVFKSNDSTFFSYSIESIASGGGGPHPYQFRIKKTIDGEPRHWNFALEDKETMIDWIEVLGRSIHSQVAEVSILFN